MHLILYSEFFNLYLNMCLSADMKFAVKQYKIILRAMEKKLEELQIKAEKAKVLQNVCFLMHRVVLLGSRQLISSNKKSI